MESLLQKLLSGDFWFHAFVVVCAVGIALGILLVFLNEKNKTPTLTVMSFIGVFITGLLVTLSGKKKE